LNDSLQFGLLLALFLLRLLLALFLLRLLLALFLLRRLLALFLLLLFAALARRAGGYIVALFLGAVAALL